MPGMASVFALWLPILVSAVFVFVASSVIHMALQTHKGDYAKLPDEDGVMDALRSKAPPGQYMFPCASSMKEFGSPEMQAKLQRGPIGTLIVRDAGSIHMGKALLQWFVACLVIGFGTAYVAHLVLAPGEGFGRVFRLTGSIAILVYGFSSVNDSIWKGVRWSTTFKFVLDGIVYGLVTGAVFGWLWPAAV